MKPLYLVAVSVLALSAAACGPKVPAARAALDCPMKQGDLTRTGAAPDGKACTYASADGAEVTLQLVSTAGGVDTALSNIETNLLAGRVAPQETAATGARADAKASASAARAQAEAAADARGGIQMRADSDGKVSVDSDITVDGKPADGVNVQVKDGRTVVTDGDGEVTRVDLPGIHIVANDKEDTASVRVGPINIDAGGDAATIRIRRDVRLRGEALNPEKRGLRATFIYTGDDLPGGYRVVGYEAGGPKRGPITVAVVKSKVEEHDDGGLHNDVKKLVRLNGGV